MQMTPDDIQKEYDFTAGTRGSVAPLPGGKARTTIRIDEAIIEWFHQQDGGNYQTLMNTALRDYISRHSLEDLLRSAR